MPELVDGFSKVVADRFLCLWTSFLTNTPFVRKRREFVYERLLNELIHRLHCPSRPCFRPCPSLDLNSQDVSLEGSWIVTNLNYWCKSSDYEASIKEGRVHLSSSIIFILVVFAVRPHQVSHFYRSVCQPQLVGPCQHYALSTQAPPVLYNFSELSFDIRYRDLIGSIVTVLAYFPNIGHHPSRPWWTS